MLTFLPGYVAFRGGLKPGARRETATRGGNGQYRVGCNAYATAGL
jgi:hypothetical protein